MCKCKCGKEFPVLNYHLTSGSSTKCRECSHNAPLQIPVGTKNNKLTIIKIYWKNKVQYCKCKCECGAICNMNISTFHIGSIKSCAKCANFKGYEEISRGYFGRVRRGAFERGLEFNITLKDVWDVFIKQNKKCIFTGLDLNFVPNSDKCRQQNASIDRIDSNKGYLIDNIQIVHKHVNFMKYTLSSEELINYCNLISNNCLKLPNIDYCI